MILIKAHAYGNDFLLADASVWKNADAQAARRLCDRHRGFGADGLILYRKDEGRVRMRLLNADGSPSEISGNGVRCLAALLAEQSPDEREFIIDTDAGQKRLVLLERQGRRLMFRAAMGLPADLRQVDLDVAGERVRVGTLRVGNPQCVMLVGADELTEARLHELGLPLATHPHFPEGTNVELASVESADRVRILIWERGVGPTEASGTGACAAAIVAAAFGGAARECDVIAPGGTQRVEWRPDGIYLTGWAELLYEGTWLAPSSSLSPL